MTKSYIKIYGPPVLKSLKALVKVAADMSKKTAIHYHSVLEPTMPVYPASDFGRYGLRLIEPGVPSETDLEIPEEERLKLISRSGDTIGEYDFFFEWVEHPTKQQVQELIGMIDEALADCGCRYSITTR